MTKEECEIETSKGNLIFAYKWHKRELVEDSERNPMHIAWRTRGDLLEVEE